MDATNSLNESESSSEGITTTSHYEDLVDVINWAKTQSFYKEPFALSGQSLGAISVVRYAGQYPNEINLLIPCAFPYYKYVEQELNMYAKEIIKNGYCDKVSRSTGKVLRMTTAYVDDIKKLDMIVSMRHRMPVAAIFGAGNIQQFCCAANGKALILIQTVMASAHG